MAAEEASRARRLRFACRPTILNAGRNGSARAT